MTDHKISARAQKALAIMADGGQFVHRLERNSYTRREQFQYRLLRNGHVVPGFGFASFMELKSMLQIAGGGTSVSTYYRLRAQDAA